MRRPATVPAAGKIGLFLTAEQSKVVAYALERAAASTRTAMDTARLALVLDVARLLDQAAQEAKKGPAA